MARLPVNDFESQTCRGGTCVLCNRPDNDEIVFEDLEWIVISPKAPRLTGELRLIRKEHSNIWSQSMASGLTKMIELTGKAQNWRDFNLIFHITNVEHAHVHLLPRYIPVSGLELGWSIDMVKNPSVYAQRLRKMIDTIEPKQ